jgi:hypothetical protein
LDYQCPNCNLTSAISDICPILLLPKPLQFTEDDVILEKTLGEGSGRDFSILNF